MEKQIIEKIYKLIETFPAHAQILLFVLFGVALWFGRKFVNSKEFRTETMLFFEKKRLKSKKLDRLKLSEHHLFLSHKLLLLHIDRISFQDSDKNWLFQKLLYIKLDTVINIAEEFIKNSQISEKPMLLKFQFESLIFKMIAAYEDAILAAYRKKFGEVLGGMLFDYVYTKLFKPYHQKQVDFLILSIDSISLSEMHINYKISSYLSFLHLALVLAIYDCEKVFRDANGAIALMISQHNTLAQTTVRI